MGDTEFKLGGCSSDGESGSFGETNWWVVRRAGQPELPHFDAARSQLCQTYWQPVYYYVRRLGYSHEDAQDFTQEFFARLLERNYVQGATHERGKFRSYLLTMVKRFLADEWDRAHRQKRGGHTPVISLNETDTEFRDRNVPNDESTPDRVFDQVWAQGVLTQALEHLEKQCADTGKEELFRELKPFVVCDQEATYAATADRLGMTVSNVKITVHRLRKQYRELLRAEVAKTAATPEDIEEDLRDLCAVLSSKK